MPASTLNHTFGVMMKNTRNRAPTMCLIFTLFLNMCLKDPLAPFRDFLTPLKSSLSTITSTTQPAAMAKAGAALNMNLPADMAMNMAADIQTTMNMYPAVVCLGILSRAYIKPISERKKVTIPNDIASSLNWGARASAMVE